MDNLNHTFRVVWNQSLQVWQAVAETACSRGKTKSSKSARRAVVAAAALAAAASGLLSSGLAQAADLPAGAQVVGGQAQVQTQGRVMTVQQGTDKLALDWQSFNVGQGHTVNFVQPNAQAVALNRVLGSDVSLIQGALNANGKLFLVNPNGILFTPTARVDVGSLVASTLNISPADFMAGKYQFEGDSSNAVENQGQIRAAAGGTVALIAARIVNTGDIQAPAGDIALGAGRKVRLDLGGAVKLDVQEGTLNAMIEQGGALKAADGRVYLSARSARDLVSSVINQTGLIEANSLSGTGGLVALEADQIALGAASKIDATGAQGGGTVLVGGDWQGGGTLRQAGQVSMAAGALIDASATQRGDGGKVVLWSDIHRADSVTDVRGTVLAQGGTEGGNGGQVETSGHLLKVDASVVRAGAEKGVGGVWLLDPYNVTISSSATSNVTPSSSGGTTTQSPSNDNSNIDVTTITAALNSGTSVTITTGSGGSQVGDITVNSAITSTSATDVRLRLQAANTIVVNQDMAATGSGKLNVELDADNDNGTRNGGGIVILGANVSTNGGFLTVGGVASSGFNGGDLFVDGGANAITVNTLGGAVDIKGQLMVASSHASGFSINTGGGNVNVGGSIDSGNTYSYVSSIVNWLSAAQAAKNGTNGGAAAGDSYLISITSRLENSIGTYKASGTGAWMGAYRDPSSMNWYWVGGPEAGGTYAVNGATPLTAVSGANGDSFFRQGSGLTTSGKYANFNPGEPNNYGTGENVGQFVGVVGLWNDLPLTAALGYVRETNVAPSVVNINAGAGSVSIGGSVGASKDIGQLNITAAGLTAGNINTSTGFSLVNSGAVNLGSTISGTGTLNKSGAGTLTLSGTNTYSGVTTVGQGVLQIGAGGTTGTLGTGAVTNNSTLTFNRSNVAVVGNAISGTGNLIQDGEGTLTLTANSTYTGTNTINHGTLVLQNNAPNPSIKSFGGTGALGIESSGDSFSSSFTTTGWNFAPTLTRLTIGKPSNASGVVIGGDITINGPITTYSSDFSTVNGARMNVSSNGHNISFLANGQLDLDRLTVDAGAGDILLRGATFGWGTDSAAVMPIFNGTGGFTLEPSGASFGQGFYTPWIRFNASNSSYTTNGASFSSFTLGKPGNTANIDLSAPIHGAPTGLPVAGPITIYGGDVSVNTHLSSTLSGAKVLVQSTGHITTAANTSITTNGGDLVLWSDSDNNAAGGIQINKGVTLDTRTVADRTANTHTTGGGRIVLAGGLDDGGTASGIQGQTAGDGRPDGYAVNMTNSNGAVTGVLLGDRSLTNSSATNISLLSGGGNISVFGAASSSSGNLLTIGVQAHQGYTLDAGTTGSILLAGSGQGAGSFSNWALGYDLAAWRMAGNQSAPSVMRTVNGNIAIVGWAGNTANVNNTIGIAIDADVSDRVTLAVTGTGSVYLQGTAAPGAQAMRLTGIDILAASGGVQLIAPAGKIHFQRMVDDVVSHLGARAGSIVPSSTSNILVRGDALFVDSTLGLNFATSGTLTVEPYATSFSSALDTAYWTLPSTLSALTLGKSGNTANVTTANAATVAGPISIYGGNVILKNDLVSTALAAPITINSVNGFYTFNADPTVASARMALTSNGGAISILAGGQLNLDYMTVNAGSGNILVRGSTFQWNTAAAGQMPVFNGSGSFTLEPPAADASFVQGFNSYWLRYNDNGSTFSSFTLGKAGNTADVNHNVPLHNAPALSVAGPISIYGGNIGIDAVLTATGNNTITLTGSGSVTDGSTGGIVANQLAVLGGNVTLDSANNQVGTLAASGVSGFTYVNSGALTIGTVNPVGITATGPVSVSTRSGDLTLGASISTTNTTSSAMTLNAGSSAAAGSAAGGNIVVTGTPSLSTGTGGRATLYTGGVSGSSSLLGLTGLASGSGRFRYNSDESTSRFTTALGAGLYAVYREQPMVGLSGGNQSIIYGEAAPTMNSAAVNGDAGNVGVQGNVLSGAGKLRVGTYAVGSADLTALGYGGGGTLEVTRKPATISGITAASKVYDANAAATVNTSAASGWIVGDNVVVQTTGTFDSKHVGNAKVVTLGNTSYIGADASNYDFTAQASTTANVTPKAISIRGITAASKLYDAGVEATVSTSAASGWISGDAFSVSATGAFDSKNIGTGKTVTLTSTYAGEDVGNYTITPQANTSANVTAKPITIGGITAVDKVYDGSTAASVLVSGATGWISGDDVSLQVTGQFDDKNVRTGKTVTLTSTLSGADVGNYAITSQANTTASVTARTLTAAVVNVPTKTYDGNTTAALTQANFQLSNVVAGEGFAVTQTSGSYNSKDVVTANSVTSNLSTNQFAPATGTLASNYVLPSVATGAGQITPRVVGAMVVNTPTKTYDGNTTAVLNNANFQLSNVVNGEAFAVTQTSGTFNSQDVLTANTVTSQLNANHFTPSQGAVASNYVLPTVTNGAGVITARPLTITADDQKKITGEVDPALTYVLQNLVQGDALQGQVVRAVGESVGEYAIDASGLRNSNYQVTYVNGALTVTPLVQAAGPLTSLMPNPLSLTSALPPVQNLFSYQNAQLTQFGGMVLIPVKAEQLVTAVGGTARSSDAAVIDMVQSARSMGFSGMLVVNGGVSLPAQAQ